MSIMEMNEILDRINYYGGGIKSIQRGVATKQVNGGTATANIAISNVNGDKSMVLITAKSANTNAPQAVITNLESTELTIELAPTQSGAYPGNVKIGWQVIEFY